MLENLIIGYDPKTAGGWSRGKKDTFLARCIFAGSAEWINFLYGLTQRRVEAQEPGTRDGRVGRTAGLHFSSNTIKLAL